MTHSRFPPLVLLHGMFGEGRDFTTLARFLEEELPGLRVVAPDLPGHGENRLEEGRIYSPSVCAAWLVRELSEAGISRCVLAGYSMGGRIALQTAIEFPSLCRGLIGISTSSGIESAEERKTRRESDRLLAQKLRSLRHRGEVVEFFLRWWTSPPFCSPAWTPEVFGPFVERRADAWNPEVARILEDCSQGVQEPLRTRLKNLPCPALFLAGSVDAKYASLAEQMAGECPDGTCMVFPGHGHALVFENPAALASEIAAWMLRHFPART